LTKLQGHDTVILLTLQIAAFAEIMVLYCVKVTTNPTIYLVYI
jgi:hypothetical protein